MDGADVTKSVSRFVLLCDVAEKRGFVRTVIAVEYLGDSETLNREWLREPEEAPDSGN